MKKKIKIVVLAAVMLLTVFSVFTVNVQAAGVALSFDEQWIVGLNTNYEYITQTTYDKQSASAANNKYWTSLTGGTRPNGTKYAGFALVESNKLQVASAWYGQDVYFRIRGSSGQGNIVKIPEYSQLKEKYKKAIKIFNGYSADTGMSFYGFYIKSITDSNNYLLNTSTQVNITVADVAIDNFNKAPLNYLTDAEGNYIYDLVAIGAYTDKEPDLSGAAAWVLKDYISEGYGFLIGHDTMYGYGGVNPDPKYTPNKYDTTTPMYVNNTKTNGHWNMNWLMGVNKLYTQASPWEAASMILNIGDYTDKSTLYGDDITYSGGISELRIAAVTPGNPLTDVAARCPTNYPYNSGVNGLSFSVGSQLVSGATHSNQQLAYGKVWLDFKSNTTNGKLLTDKNSGLTGTNNFYLTTNGNFGMMQIGHSKTNLSSAAPSEARILANTIMYLSQRQPCQICQSKQGGNNSTHAVKRITSAAELSNIGKAEHWFTYPIDGCYVLANDITLPASWTPIKGFAGHFNADNHKISTNGKAVFEQKGVLGSYNLVSPLSKGWNLGSDSSKGLNKISNGGGVLTAVARVEGYINALFGTPSEIDYSNYKIVVTDENGAQYDCVTNREGKYVISNLPCTDTMYYAKVYDAAGAEITQYGAVSVVIPQGFWNSCETLALQLTAPKTYPVADIKLYEEQSTSFEASADGTASSVKWEYKKSEATGWIDIKYADFEYSISEMTFQNGKTFSSLIANNVSLECNDTYIRAVFKVGDKEYNTFDVKTPKNSGRITVLERPMNVISPADSSVWENDNLVFTATGNYYKSFNNGVTVVWQFRGNSSSVWENVGGSEIIKNAYSSESVKNRVDNISPYSNISTLVIKNATPQLNGYEFRAVYKYPGKSKTWASAPAKADIKITKIICTQNPTNASFNLQENGYVGTNAWYSVEFTYVGKSPAAPKIIWEARTKATGEFSNISPSIASTSINAPVATGRPNEYKVNAFLMVHNPNSSMDTGDIHYYFRAKAEYESLYTYSESADLSLNYRIDIIAGEPTMTKRADAGYDYVFDKLRITAPNGLSSVRVKFTASKDGRNTLSYPALPWAITAHREGEFWVFNSHLQATSIWQNFLRQIVFSIYSDTEKIYFYVDEQQSEYEYNPETGKFEKHIYEFVYSPNITWTQAYSDARTRYNNTLQTYGKLVTIKDAAENTKARQTLGGWAPAWIGATSDPAYNGWVNDWRWVDGRPLYYENQRPDTPWQHKYMYMLPDGGWSRAPNVRDITATTTDRIDWWNGWAFGGTANGVRFHAAENISGEVYTGLALYHRNGWNGTAWNGWNTTATKKVYLEHGHTYWFSTRFGESGDANTSVSMSFPALGLWAETVYDFPWRPSTTYQLEIANLYTFWGTTGEYEIVYSTLNTGGTRPDNPNGEGYGQVFYCDLINLTEAFGSELSKATYQWCYDNLRCFSGSKIFQFTSSTSTMQGYIVEYERSDFGFGRTNHSADDESTVIKPKEWTPGREGVRVTVVNADTGTPYRAAFDLSKNTNSDVTRHYGYISKTEYRSGASLTASSAKYTSMQRALPQIIVPGGTNLSAIKSYFSQNDMLSFIAGRVGLTIEQLKGGRYKILLEPVIYLPLNGGLYAMTATEASIYNAEHNDALREQHKNITHQALPFSMFLTEDDLGFTAWRGSVNTPVSDGVILQNLGLCIIRFGSATPPPNMTEMRTNTDVYLSCDVSTNGEIQTSPDSPAWVSFSVNGQTLTHNNIYLPAGGSQRAYVKWRTPTAPGIYTVTVASSANVKPSVSSFIVNITGLVEQMPPDPKATDRNDAYVRPISTPRGFNILTSSWLEYSCKKENGKWTYHPHYYNAKLSLSVSVQPDERVPTAIQNANQWEIKSGYGINITASSFTTSQSPNIVKAQTGIAYFPEFLYATYNRILEAENGLLQLKSNIYSQWKNRVHFTPLWYPDGSYTPFVKIRDVWTPGGELQASGQNTIQIKGSVFDDWYVAKGK